MKVVAFVRRLVRDDRGITMVEYAIMAALIAAALVIAVPVITTAVSNGFTIIGGDIPTK